MTANDIRKVRIARSALGEATELQLSEFQCAMLQEIAAQLAEINDRFERSPTGSLPIELVDQNCR